MTITAFTLFRYQDLKPETNCGLCTQTLDLMHQRQQHMHAQQSSMLAQIVAAASLLMSRLPEHANSLTGSVRTEQSLCQQLVVLPPDHHIEGASSTPIYLYQAVQDRIDRYRLFFQELVAVLPKKPETADDQTSYTAIHTNKMLIYLDRARELIDNTDFLDRLIRGEDLGMMTCFAPLEQQGDMQLTDFSDAQRATTYLPFSGGTRRITRKTGQTFSEPMNYWGTPSVSILTVTLLAVSDALGIHRVSEHNSSALWWDYSILEDIKNKLVHHHSPFLLTHRATPSVTIVSTGYMFGATRPVTDAGNHPPEDCSSMISRLMCMSQQHTTRDFSSAYRQIVDGISGWRYYASGESQRIVNELTSRFDAVRSTVAIGDVLGYFTFKNGDDTNRCWAPGHGHVGVWLGQTLATETRSSYEIFFAFTREVETNVDGFGIDVIPAVTDAHHAHDTHIHPSDNGSVQASFVLRPKQPAETSQAASSAMSIFAATESQTAPTGVGLR
jgi:hypothetical protein